MTGHHLIYGRRKNVDKKFSPHSLGYHEKEHKIQVQTLLRCRLLLIFLLGASVAMNASLLLHREFPASLQGNVHINARTVVSAFPEKPPHDLFPDFNKCKVVFRDSSMATCHLAAFGGNFGDLMGPDIVKRVVEIRFGCSASELPVMDFENNATVSSGRPCLWSVGSVWRHVRPNDHVWGTGALGADWEFDACNRTAQGQSANITIYSARGPDTVKTIHRLCGSKVNIPSNAIVPRGDAGFLIPYIFPEFRYNPKKADLEKCLVAHFFDDERLKTKLKKQKDFGIAPEACLPVVQPWRTMVGNITRCKALVSSSLHGIVTADAFGVPVVWKSGFNIASFKFLDYFRSFPHGHQSTSVVNYGVALKFENGIPDPITESDRRLYAEEVIKTFPHHLFTTEEL